MATPSVLVVVPSYNHGAFIGDRVKSILAQSHRNFELYVVDDCSTDHTMEVLAKFSDQRMAVSRRAVNSGSPFQAWLDAAELLNASRFDYVWIAESDDRADTDFLKRAATALENSPAASLYYCHSWFINDADLIIGHSINYLKRIFSNVDWDRRWQKPGWDFIKECLVRGMAIPNMSSALIRADAFRAAVRTSFARYKLAADWVFATHAASLGEVIFDPWDGNYFRHHTRTSRQETDLPRLLFEHMSATRTAFLSGVVDPGEYSAQMRVWARMYRQERVGIAEFLKWGWKISRRDLPPCLLKLAGI